MILVALLATAFFAHKKIINGLHIAVKGLFIGGLFGVIISLFIPAIYYSIVENTILDNEVGVQLKVADEWLVDSSKELNQINIFRSDNTFPIVDPFLFPSVLSLLSQTARVIGLIVSLFFMVLSVYLKYSVTNFTETEMLARKIKKIERLAR